MRGIGTLTTVFGRALGVVVAAAMAASATSGCTGEGADYGCPDITGCGGDPTATGQDPPGNWNIHSWCQYVPPFTYTVTPPPSPQIWLNQAPAKTPAASKASGDWCQSIVYTPANSPGNSTGQARLTFPTLNHTPGVLTGATVNLDPNSHTYQVAISTSSSTTTHFAPSCLTAFGNSTSCTDFETQLAASYGVPNYQNTVCSDASDGGCDCSFLFAGAAADQGTWRTVGDTLYFFSAFNELQPIVETTYCSSNHTLSISGKNGTSLFAVAGLRTLTLVPGT
jgi:hypothetical protein